MPCGNTSIPAPKLFTRFPFASNFRIGSTFAESRQLFAPHRSATQMLVPSGSISTALVEPQVRPAGIFAQPSMVRYGLGKSLTGAIVAVLVDGASATCAVAQPVTATITVAARATLIRCMRLDIGVVSDG